MYPFINFCRFAFEKIESLLISFTFSVPLNVRTNKTKMMCKIFRKELFPFFIGIMFILNSYGQEWTLINPYPTIENLEAVYFLNPDTGFVSGEFCKLLRTTDGGETWYENDTLTYGRFMSITFINNDTGFVVGGNSIMRTNDCGETWITMGPHVGTDYYDIFFLNDTCGWVVGDYNTVIRTTDGGNNWEILSHSVGISNFFYRVEFISPDTGYICGKYGSVFSYGILKKTYDGGETWIEIFVPEETRSLKGLETLGDSNVWIGESRQVPTYNGPATRIYHTTNDGQTWDTISLAYYSNTVNRIKFLNPLQGKVLTGNKMFSSEDGGLSWNSSSYGALTSMRDMSWSDASNCVVAGYRGLIYKSNDAGQSWNEVSKGFRASFQDVEFIDEMRGVAVGYNTENEIIYYTDDGGINWDFAVLDTAYEATYLKNVVFDENGNAWVGGWGYMLRSVDAGVTWIHIETGFSILFQAMDAYQDKYIWAGGWGGKLIRSKDFGNSWEDISLPTNDHLSIIAFSDSLNGYLTVEENKKSGYTLLYKTNDGGDTWHEITHSGGICPIYSISAPDFNTVYMTVYYYGLLKSSDAGDTWETIGEVGGVLPSYVKFIDPETGVTSKNDYFVAYTWDGGEHWDIELNTAPHGMPMKSVFFLDFNNAWIVGTQGLIMKYYNPFVRIDESAESYYKSDQPLIYPNPVSDKLTIAYQDPVDMLKVFDLSGKLLIVESGEDVNKVDTRSLSPGTYILEVRTKRSSFSLKFVKM